MTSETLKDQSGNQGEAMMPGNRESHHASHPPDPASLQGDKSTKPGRYDFHSIAEILPKLPSDELQALADDIKDNGLQNPICLYEGKILDGRNRYEACVLADVNPEFVTYGGNDPLGHVISHNLRQRHLSASQRAMIAAKLANLEKGDNQHSSIELTSQASAAKMLNVGIESVKRAKNVQDNAVPELIKAVEEDKVSVSAVAKALKWSKADQQYLATNGVGRLDRKAGKSSRSADNVRDARNKQTTAKEDRPPRQGNSTTGKEVYPYERAANSILALKENEQGAALDLAAKGLGMRPIPLERFDALQRAEKLSKRQATPDGMAETFKRLTPDDQDAVIEGLQAVLQSREARS
jgi:hypothetical protein